MTFQCEPSHPGAASLDLPAGAGSAVDRALETARNRIEPRVRPEDLAAETATGALIVDTRPSELRARDGLIAGAVVIERNVLEWRLDPTSPHRIDGMDSAGRRVIVVCDEGYASSLAAAALMDLGLTNVTDLAGGYQGLRRTIGDIRRR
jgi:rhodanese-related sulfurtransferase